MIDRYKRVYAKIDFDAFNYNFNNICNATKNDTKVMAVLKTDGYGHGAIPLAKEIQDNPKLFGFALATADEAMIMRGAGITKPILILGYVFKEAYEDMIKNNISIAVFREDMLEDIAAVCRSISDSEHEYKASVHIKVDTGMSRIGIMPDDSGMSFVKKALSYKEIKVDGIFTHFAKADELDRNPTNIQFAKFFDFIKRIETETGYKIPIRHCSNSAGIIDYPEVNLDMVRAGIILYGLWPSSEVSKDKVLLKPLLSLYSHIVYLKTIDEGVGVSYGGTYVADSKVKIATIPVGYGDGYPRGLSNKGEVIIRGKRCPIVGRVCMDQMMVDVSKLSDVSEGDLVTLIGTEGNETITMEELGDISGRFNYELACDLGKRIPRVYIKDNRVITTKDYNKDF